MSSFTGGEIVAMLLMLAGLIVLGLWAGGIFDSSSGNSNTSNNSNNSNTDLEFDMGFEDLEPDNEETLTIPKDYLCGGTDENSNTCPVGKICKIATEPDRINTCVVDQDYVNQQRLQNNPCLAMYGTKSVAGTSHNLSGLSNKDNSTRYNACVSNTSCNIYVQNVSECSGRENNWWRCDSATPEDGKIQIGEVNRGFTQDLFHCTPEMRNATGVCKCREPSSNTGYGEPVCEPQSESRWDDDGNHYIHTDFIRKESICTKHLTQLDCVGVTESGDQKEHWPYRGNPGAVMYTCAWYENED